MTPLCPRDIINAPLPGGSAPAENPIWNVALIAVGVVTTLRTRIPGLVVANEAPVRFVPVRETLTVSPALPLFGVKAVMVGAPTPPVLRVIESRFPTASYRVGHRAL